MYGGHNRKKVCVKLYNKLQINVIWGGVFGKKVLPLRQFLKLNKKNKNMKTGLFGLVSLLVVMTSCKSKESAYKQAYEKAKAQETAQVQVNAPMQVTPVAAPEVTEDYDATPVRQEQVVAVSGELKAYSVVCGSFSLQTNAQALKENLVNDGYQAGIVKNVDKNMFRVIIGSYDTKAEAAKAREAFKMKYPNRADFQGAWILYSK